MSQQPLSHKDAAFSPRVRLIRNDESPRRRLQGRSQTLFRNVMEQSSQLLDQICYDPCMPVRGDYASHDDWLRALLATSLDQAPDMNDLFGSSSLDNEHQEDDQSTKSSKHSSA